MLGNDWDIILKDELQKKYFKDMMLFLKEEYNKKTVYPKKEEIFKAFKLTPYKNVKVVILGQDPYHGYEEAEGLSFSVKEGIKMPPSLKNIFKELKDDLGYEIPKNGSLVKWAKEGVLLLNTVLTVVENTPTSHKGIGWEIFTDEVIRKINDKKEPVVFILWGNYAKSKSKLITNKNHYILASAHPSPFSVYNGFFGSKPFSKTNSFLRSKNIKEIDWQIK